MKKALVFIFLGFIASSARIFSMEKEEDSVKEDAKVEFSKLDGVKVTAASLGCLFFILAVVRTYPLSNLYDLSGSGIRARNNDGWLNYPLIAVSLPLLIGAIGIMKILGINDKHAPIAINGVANLSALTSVLGASGCGWYIWKKLSKLRSQNSVKQKYKK